MTKIHYTLQPDGDQAILVHFPSLPDGKRAFLLKKAQLLPSQHLGIVDIVAGYETIHIHYDALIFSYKDVCAIINLFLKTLSFPANTPYGKHWLIPVCYGGEVGPDLEAVASHAGMTTDEVIDLHSQQTYTIQFIGFLPGFPYLKGLPKPLSMARRSNPRPHVPVGSVGIGGQQTGIYPVASPGGWQLIGRTPLPLFLPDNDPPCYLKAGDTLAFQPIKRDVYEALHHSPHLWKNDHML
ncbi:5-oxoprolinase subunit PxpB [Bacillaceae bacterium SIJ1]|uniref:5-oxoprolinase subunit PxpB n=1 Tax=Litoribacterium kuwaitense TaxID=1398745 RepID=UPI0013EAC403|nr:5-oxoprolinase subunit PxpB [Litoribacterium kuwaitense]NGP44689.1 5-oxoprolinase subunit PxpB [Litoribacterium kuwaitense]